MKKFAGMVLGMSVLFGTMPGALVEASPIAATNQQKEQISAIPTLSAVWVNGKQVSMEGYNIGGSNYFKLRDLAKALEGTEKRFAVDFDGAGGAIHLQPGQAYKSIGGELTGSDRMERKKATTAGTKITVNGSEVSLSAYNIEGSTYFKLRDLGQALNIPVIWRALDNSVRIMTTAEVAVTTTDAKVYSGTTDDYYYSNWFEPSDRYLYKEGSTLNLLEANEEEQAIHIQQFDESYSRVKEFTIPMELPLFGGFHQGEDGNYYVVYGQSNDEESNTKPVYQVVKYDTGWTKLAQVDISNVYVSEPFDAGNLTMDSSGGKLAVHSTRQRYTSTDGLRHQSNISFLIDMKTMAVLKKGEQWPDNHVSHSFAAYVKFDGNRLVYVDHGDAYPRSIVMQLEQGGEITRELDLISFAGEIGDNYTGGYLGGLEVSSSNYLVAGSSRAYGAETSDSGQNVFVSVVPKTAQSESAVKTVWLTKHSPDSPIQIKETHLARINDNKYVLLWGEEEGYENDPILNVAVLDGQGNMIGEPQALPGVPLPGNMNPLVEGDYLTWYYGASADYRNSGPTTQQSTDTLEFYTLKVE